MDYLNVALVAAIIAFVLLLLIGPPWRPSAPAGSRGDPPFDTRSLDFERGVEFGLLFARVVDDGHVRMAMHADMAEVVIRLAESRDLPFSGKPHEHDEHCSESIGRSDCKDGGEWLDVMIG